MDSADIQQCVYLISDLLPQLRDMLDLTQKEFASFLGITRQSLIGFEHQNRKISRPVLAAIVSYFSLRPETAAFLLVNGLYDNAYVNSLGFNRCIVNKIIISRS